jgi:hypothetical protein
MTQNLDNHKDNLRRALLELKPTGSNGFEGLIGTVLTGITGIPFRHAASGSQHGIDGKAAYQDDGVAFEAKRYDKEQLSRTDVLSKLADIGMHDAGITDLWILGATTPVSTQIQDAARKRAEKDGISVLILDWCDNDLPVLGVALAMAESASRAHLEKNLPPETFAKVVAALQAFQQCDLFQSYADRLRSELKEPTIGFGTARQANVEWLTEVFSNKDKATTTLGQALSPHDASAYPPIARQDLIDRITPYLTKQPDNTILGVVGGEGNGKSWLVAQSWLSLNKPPLMLVITPEDVERATGQGSPEELLIPKLIEQTNNHTTEAVKEKWGKTLDRWHNISTDSPRIIVFVDGINQRPRLSWNRILDRLAAYVSGIGGRLIVSSRTAYFDLLPGALLRPVVEVEVPEWTEVERDQVLSTHNIQGNELNAQVAQSLRNPRILGIALALMEVGEIEKFEEISVSRLLFEHMRRHGRDSETPLRPDEFARRLRDHGTEIIGRIRAAQNEDLNTFEGELEAVADGRFFVPVEGDPWRYTLDERGLTLALGLAVIDKVVAADRNQRDMDATLDEILEPVSALDEMGKVVLASLTSACIDTRYLPRIGAVLVRAFARLQNPEDGDFDPFGALARKRPEAFVLAAEKLCLARAHEPNRDWVEFALVKAAFNSDAWPVIAGYIHKWLAFCSFSPEQSLRAHLSRDPVEKVEQERAKKQKQIEERLGALCPVERQFLDELEDSGEADIAELWHLAFKLSAGKPLAPFASSFTKWCFAFAINPPFGAPYKEFLNLVRFNRLDWSETRAAIVEDCAWLDSAEISNTGKWALVGMLRATGAIDEAEREARLVAEFTKGRDFKGRWLVEEYCASDPCDPHSRKPANVAKTAASYKAIDVSKLRRHLSHTGDDLFFVKARPGIVRFEPEVAIAKHEELIDDIVDRTGFPLRQGLFELHDDNALLGRAQALRLLDAGVKVASEPGDETLSETDRFTVDLYSKITAFPLIEAEEQLGAIISDPMNTSRYLDLLEVAKPIGAKKFDDLLKQACDDEDEEIQRRILAFGPLRQGTVTERLRACCVSLVSSASEEVRANALRFIHYLDDEELLRFVVDSSWSAQRLEDADSHEAWRGSLVVIRAAERGIVPEDEAMVRIVPQAYGRASRKLGAQTVQNMALSVDAAIQCAASATISKPTPQIDLTLQNESEEEPNRYQVSDRPSNNDDPIERLREFPESTRAFEERQERLRNALETVKAELDDKKARMVLESFTLSEFRVLAESEPGLLEKWYQFYSELPRHKAETIHNFGLVVAHAMARRCPKKSAQLFAKLEKNEPFVRVRTNAAGTTLDAEALWSAAIDPNLQELCFERLNDAANDHELALEVLAALTTGREGLLRDYIELLLATAEPAWTCRALMVAGFSDSSSYNDQIMSWYEKTSGFIGKAHKAARYAYERNRWAQHWFAMMCESKTASEFWCNSVLFTEVVDGRFEIWKMQNATHKELFETFWPSVKSNLKPRYKKWAGKREKKLFGEDAPSRLFLIG